MDSSEFFVYFIIYILFCICIIFPPTEFIAAGLTLDSIFYKFYGDEYVEFVEYHLRRICTTCVLHTLLPFGFFVVIELAEDGFQVFDPSLSLPLSMHMCMALSVILPLSVFTLMMYWYMNDWAEHPTVKQLRLYSQNWRQVASTINMEYRSIDKFCVSLGGVKKVVVTDSWVLLISSYKLELSQQADVRLKVIASDEHAMSHHGEAAVQFINLLVENTDKPIKPFVLRMNSLHYRDLRDKLQSPIETAVDVIVHQNLSELFVDAFREQALINRKAILPQDQIDLLDLCLGCSQVQADVKLEKNCLDEVDRQDEEGTPVPNCRQCFCRPMWCVACMGRWFASRQDAHRPDKWMSAKCPCPTCRAIFCTLDVCIVTSQE